MFVPIMRLVDSNEFVFLSIVTESISAVPSIFSFVRHRLGLFSRRADFRLSLILLHENSRRQNGWEIIYCFCSQVR
jgi:hypothetical protein